MAELEKNTITSLSQLEPIHRVCVSHDTVNTEILLNLALAKTLSYMFQVPMPAPVREDSGRPYYQLPYYPFPPDTVRDMELQLDGITLGELGDGNIRLSTLLMLENSPRFPYRIDRTSTTSCRRYEFVIRRDVFKATAGKRID